MKDRPFSFVSILTGNIRSPKEGLFQDYFGNYVWRFHTLPLFITLTPPPAPCRHDRAIKAVLSSVKDVAFGVVA